MNRRFPFAFVVFASVFFPCCSSGTDPDSEQSVADIAVTHLYTQPNGGDPRGTFYPNSPLLWYFGGLVDSLGPNSGTGTLQFAGASSTAGSFAYQGSARVGGRIGSVLLAIPPGEENTTGTWERFNNQIVLSTGQRRDTVGFGVGANALYFITHRLTNVPPVSSLSADVEANPARDTLVWVFKR